MNELQIFNSAEFGSVRTVTIDDVPYFVGKDVADILEYQNGSRDINRHVDEEDKTKIMIFDGNQNKESIVINESGLYGLILSSKMPSAKMFKRWVTTEVIPSIRKHGVYAIDDLLNDPDMLIAALEELKSERVRNKALSQTVVVQNQQIVEMMPKASYYDVVLNCKDLVAISTISKDYGWSATKMNRYLNEKGVQYKQGDIWLLYQKHAEQGYTSTKMCPYNGNDGTHHTRPHTYWTQKGRLFIYGLLKANGVLPIMDRKQK